MENKLEQLLNMLIQRGWKPFGIDYSIHIHYYEFNDVSLYRIGITIGGNEVLLRRISHSLRDIVSAESGLWQFVCENGMVEEESCQYIEDKEICTSDEWICYYNDDGYPMDNYYKLNRTEAKFWIIESALKDESELEKFLLDNINV